MKPIECVLLVPVTPEAAGAAPAKSLSSPSVDAAFNTSRTLSFTIDIRRQRNVHVLFLTA